MHTTSSLNSPHKQMPNALHHPRLYSAASSLAAALVAFWKLARCPERASVAAAGKNAVRLIDATSFNSRCRLPSVSSNTEG
jgi:hypothetical protein